MLVNAIDEYNAVVSYRDEVLPNEIKDVVDTMVQIRLETFEYVLAECS